MSAVIDDEVKPVRAGLLASAALRLFLAAVGAVCVLFVFDWDPGSVAAGALIGTVLWGGGEYVMSTRHYVPRGELVPDCSAVRPPGHLRLRDAPRLLAAIAVAAGLAWLADRMHLGAVVVPGQFLGYACADALGVLRVARWERSHGGSVVFREDGSGDPSLYAHAAA